MDLDFKSVYIKYKIFLIPVVVSLASLSIIALVIVPQTIEYFNAHGKISQIEQKKSFVEAKVEELENINESLYIKNLQVAYIALPKDREIPESMLILQNLISEASLNLDSIRVLGTGLGGTAQSSYQLGIVVSGTLSSIKDLFIKLQNSPRIFKVENYSVQLSGSAAETDITLTTYFDPTNITSQPPDQQLPRLTDQEQQILTKLSKASQYIPSQESISASVEFGKADPFE